MLSHVLAPSIPAKPVGAPLDTHAIILNSPEWGEPPYRPADEGVPTSRLAGRVEPQTSVESRGLMAVRYEYKVVELREGLIGGKMSGDKLEKTLNDHAAQGWQLKAITAVQVKGRIGPGGVEGVLVTFERPMG